MVRIKAQLSCNGIVISQLVEQWLRLAVPNVFRDIVKWCYELKHNWVILTIFFIQRS